MVEQLTARDRAAEARYRLWQMLDQPWDLVVIGGGITGAGVLLEAARMGYRAVLLEQRDFAWGTSSRSGKLVHGGLRYLRHGQVRLTWQSVRERERLLREAPGLVLPLGIVFPDFRGAPVSGRLLRLGLVIYDVMAMRWGHRRCSPPELQGIFPHVRIRDLKGGLWYRDAVTDDARLVLRVIREAERRGALALNYARVHELRRTHSGRVEGVAVRDLLTGRTAEVKARVVVNAAGIWADEVRAWLGRAPRLRLLRGSHLVFPAWRLPVSQGINLFHPVDGRPLYVLPWDGVTLVGTTDLDYEGELAAEPAITPAELDYLLTAANYLFPSLGLSEKDVLATFSGVRGVVGTGRKDPSRESREHAIWAEGIITVAGGKLTTFRILALDALRRALEQLGPPRLDRRRASPPAG
ncbi:MAG: glycerol-3-phosphate dehydrogenase/oxidase, partial [Bacillota bacterium]